MGAYHIIILLGALLIGACVFLLPAVIIKALIVSKRKPTGRLKVITMLLLGFTTLVIMCVFAFMLNGGVPSTSKWALWMIIDYFYIFGWEHKKSDKEVDYEALYAEIEKLKAEKNGASPEAKKSQLAKDNIADDAVI